MAIHLYNTHKRENPEQTERVVTTVRQTTTVLSAFISAVVAIMDALAGITRIFISTRAPSERPEPTQIRPQMNNSGGPGTWGRPASAPDPAY